MQDKIVIGVMLLFISCAKNVTDESYSELIGKWKAESFSYLPGTNFLGVQVSYDYLPEEDDLFPLQNEYYLEFTEREIVKMEDQSACGRGRIEYYGDGTSISSKAFEKFMCDGDRLIFQRKGSDTLFVSFLCKGLPLIGENPVKQPILCFVRQ